MATDQCEQLFSAAPIVQPSCGDIKNRTDALFREFGNFGTTAAGQMYVLPFTHSGSPYVDYQHLGEEIAGTVTVYLASRWDPAAYVEAICPRQRPWNRQTIMLDFGTRAIGRVDLIAASNETSIRRLVIDTNTVLRRLKTRTRMSRILELAPLSLRLWAEVFGVTHGAIRKWRTTDPDRPELTIVLDMLEQASLAHGELAQWLRRPVASTEVTPLNLLKQARWRAFLGAIRTASAPVPDLGREALERLRRERLPWASTDAPGIPVEA